MSSLCLLNALFQIVLTSGFSFSLSACAKMVSSYIIYVALQFLSLGRIVACELYKNRETLINQCFITIHVGCVMFGCGDFS